MTENVSIRNLSGRSVGEYRAKAALDLICRVPNRAPRRIADVYSGQGSMKALLARRFPGAEIKAFDLSQSNDGLAESRPHRFRGHGSADGAQRATDTFDLICWIGALETLPSLRALLPELVTMTVADGCLAVQIPNNLYEPSRALIRMIAADGPWAKKLLPIAKTRPFNESMEGLYALLGSMCASVDIWETTYLYALNGVASIVELMKATSLAPFLKPLDDRSREKFLGRYGRELGRAYPAQPDGKVLARFSTISVLAQQ